MIASPLHAMLRVLGTPAFLPFFFLRIQQYINYQDNLASIFQASSVCLVLFFTYIVCMQFKKQNNKKVSHSI